MPGSTIVTLQGERHPGEVTPGGGKWRQISPGVRNPAPEGKDPPSRVYRVVYVVVATGPAQQPWPVLHDGTNRFMRIVGDGGVDPRFMTRVLGPGLVRRHFPLVLTQNDPPMDIHGSGVPSRAFNL